MISVLTLAYIIEEKDNEIILTDDSMIQFILGVRLHGCFFQFSKFQWLSGCFPNRTIKVDGVELILLQWRYFHHSRKIWMNGKKKLWNILILGIIVNYSTWNKLWLHLITNMTDSVLRKSYQDWCTWRAMTIIKSQLWTKGCCRCSFSWWNRVRILSPSHILCILVLFSYYILVQISYRCRIDQKHCEKYEFLYFSYFLSL